MDAEKLAAIRKGLSEISQQTLWDAYDLAQEVIAYIDGDKYTIFN